MAKAFKNQRYGHDGRPVGERDDTLKGQARKFNITLKQEWPPDDDTWQVLYNGKVQYGNLTHEVAMSRKKHLQEKLMRQDGM